jgi:hypothetical protein
LEIMSEISKAEIESEDYEERENMEGREREGSGEYDFEKGKEGVQGVLGDVGPGLEGMKPWRRV